MTVDYISINFHPSGEPEAFIFCVAKGSNQSSLFELRPDRVKNYDVALRSAFGGPMKASDSCKIQVCIIYLMAS